MEANLHQAEHSHDDLGNRVLICTRDPELYLLLAHILQSAGYLTSLADSEEDAIVFVAHERPLSVVVDGLAWEGDATRLCAAAKEAGSAICALIGQGMEAAHLKMIKAGLDDGLARPLAPTRLIDFLGRVKVPSDTLAPLMNLKERCPTIDGKRLRMTELEARLFEFLRLAGGEARSRQDILSAVWPGAKDVSLRTVDVQVGRLRKVLSARENVRIETVYGRGYALVLT